MAPAYLFTTVLNRKSDILKAGISGVAPMRLRAKLILSFLGLAVVPLATITIYSYNASLRALRSAAEQESSAMASDMSSRMESVSRDLNRQLEWFAGH